MLYIEYMITNYILVHLMMTSPVHLIFQLLGYWITNKKKMIDGINRVKIKKISKSNEKVYIL